MALFGVFRFVGPVLEKRYGIKHGAGNANGEPSVINVST
jgi:hypothetical protein